MTRLPLLAVLLGLGVSASASDDRERAARAALALAAKPAASEAPAPRVAAKTYPAGYAAAVADEKPLVVFVSCPSWSVPDAVVAKAPPETFPGVKGPAAVVAYPQGSRVFIETTIPDPNPAQVADAVKAAKTKVVMPPAKARPAAPKPLDWSL